MNDAVRKTGAWTWAGLFIELLGIPAIVTLARVAGPLGNTMVVAREIAILALSAVLLLIVTRGEGRTLDSIGIRFDRIGRSLAQGLALAIVLFAAVVAVLAAYA